MQIDLNNFFVPQVVPEIYAKNTSFKIARGFFLLLTVKHVSRQRCEIEYFAELFEYYKIYDRCPRFVKLSRKVLRD